MRYLTTRSVSLLALLALGCSGSSSTTPSLPNEPALLPGTNATPVASVAASLGPPSQRGDIHESALAIYTVDIDPTTLTATSRLKETRSGQANDDLYLLSIDSFLNASSFKVTGVTGTATTLDVDYLVTHPFPAPNNPLGTPNGSTNRADLGIAGMALVMLDVPSANGNTYFADRIANTAAIANADAYYSPGGLLTTTGIANTFPYRQLVDEVADSRVGMSNGGNVTGNFGTDGWTRSEFGPANDGWTGYGVLHQGQSARNTFSLNKSVLGAGLSLDVAIIAKYPDPRGGATGAQKKANRLPPATADASLFAYRMPHGALDAGRIVMEAQSGDFMINTISAATLSFHLEDWDARAPETTAGDLSGDIAFDTVSVGESGAPVLDVCIPGVIGDTTTFVTIGAPTDDDSAFGGDVAIDTGQPNDALFYTDVISKPAGSGQIAGPVTGLVRATDPEVGLVVGLDENLTPLALAPEPVTYQAIFTALASNNDPPTATVALTSGDPLLSGTMPAISVSGITDFESDPVDVLVDWDMGGGFVTVASGLNSPYPAQNPVGPQNNNADLTPDAFNPIVRVQDAFGFTDYPLSYLLGPNRAPQVTGSRALANTAVATPATFTMNAGSGTATDPEGDAVSYTITNNRNADELSFASFPNAANTTVITNPPNATVAFTVYANDPLHATTLGNPYPVVNGVITNGSQIGWVYTPTSSTTGVEHGYDVGVDPAGNVWVLGEWATTAPGVDFGGGLVAALTGNPMFLVKLDGTTGTYLTHKVWTSTSTAARPMSFASDSAGNVYVSLTWAGTLQIAGLGGGAIDQVSNGAATPELGILKFDSSGGYFGMVRSNDPVSESDENPPTLQSAPTSAYAGVGQQGLVIDQTSGAIYAAICPTGAGTLDFGGVTVATGTGRDAILVRYSDASFVPAATGAATWAVNLATGGTDQRIQSLVIDPSGNIVIGGSFWGTNNDFGDGLFSTTASAQDLDAYLVKRTSAGAHIAGSFKVLKSSLNGAESLGSLASDASGLYVGGSFGYLGTGGTFSLGAPLGTLTANNCDGFIGMYTHAGTPVWQRGVTGSTSEQVNGGIHLDGSSLIAYGMANSTTAVDWGYAGLLSFASVDPVLVKYDKTNGNASFWGRQWGSAGLDYSSGSSMNAAGDPVFVFRVASAGTFDYDPGAGTALKTTLSSDLIVVKLSGATGEFF